jgi:hypothetical protein
MDTRRYIFIILMTIITAGCATPEYNQARFECNQVAYQKYPQMLQSTVVRKSTRVEVPDGNVTCSTVSIESGGTVGRPLYRTETQCRQGSKYQTRYYDDLVAIDVNESARNMFIFACVNDLCLRRYGNNNCEGGPNTNNTSKGAMECGANSDCPSGLSCRSKSGGGTICR